MRHFLREALNRWLYLNYALGDIIFQSIPMILIGLMIYWMLT